MALGLFSPLEALAGSWTHQIKTLQRLATMETIRSLNPRTPFSFPPRVSRSFGCLRKGSTYVDLLFLYGHRSVPFSRSVWLTRRKTPYPHTCRSLLSKTLSSLLLPNRVIGELAQAQYQSSSLRSSDISGTSGYQICLVSLDR